MLFLADGRPVTLDLLATGSALTAFPAGETSPADEVAMAYDMLMVVRVEPAELSFRRRAPWAPRASWRIRRCARMPVVRSRCIAPRRTSCSVRVISRRSTSSRARASCSGRRAGRCRSCRCASGAWRPRRAESFGPGRPGVWEPGVIVRRVRALDERSGRPIPSPAIRKVFPDHWSFMLGEIAMYAYVPRADRGDVADLLVRPSNARVTTTAPFPRSTGEGADAYASMLSCRSTPTGLSSGKRTTGRDRLHGRDRRSHGADLFHRRVSQAARNNWVVGLTMLLVALADGFSGYSLPEDACRARVCGSPTRSPGVRPSAPAGFLFFGGRFRRRDASRLYFSTCSPADGDRRADRDSFGWCGDKSTASSGPEPD